MGNSVADDLVRLLVQAGVTRIYGSAGDSFNTLSGASLRSGGAAAGGIDWAQADDEEAAAFAAAADARSTGRLAVCAGSCDPGIARLARGLMDARRSGAPVLAHVLHRSEQLLQLSDQLSVTVTTADVLATVPALLRDVLEATHAEVIVAGAASDIGRGPTSAAAAALSAPVRRAGQACFYADRTELMAAQPALAGEFERLGWQAAVCAPLSGAAGTLLLAWSRPRVFSADERVHIARLVDYVARALRRARRHDGWRAVAEALQGADGSQLPRVDGYEIAAHYLSADAHPTIGGDWYDVIPGRRDGLALIIGDVVGHGLVAAAGMGRLRSMLRAYLMDRMGSPSTLLRRLEAANHALGEPTMATAVVAFIEPTANGGHRLRWANAGHPPPVIVGRDGEVHALTGHDLLLGVRRSAPRHTYTYPLPAGATVLLHTDGLVERCGQHIDDNLAQLYRSLRTGGCPEELLAKASGVFTRTQSDDVAMLAVRIPG